MAPQTLNRQLPALSDPHCSAFIKPAQLSSGMFQNNTFPLTTRLPSTYRRIGQQNVVDQPDTTVFNLKKGVGGNGGTHYITGGHGDILLRESRQP